MSRDLSPWRWPGGHCAAQQRPALGRVPWLPDHADAAILPLLSFAIAKARATLQPGGLEGVQNRGCAKVHLHRESYPPLPARWRADMIAVTNQSGRAPAVGFRDGPPEAIDSARR